MKNKMFAALALSTTLVASVASAAEPASEGNGCGGIGKVAIQKIEQISEAEVANARAARRRYNSDAIRYLQITFDRQMKDLRDQYTLTNSRPPSQYVVHQDMRDLYIPDFSTMDQKMVRQCLPKFSQLIDEVKAQQDREAAALREAAKPAGRVLYAYTLYVRINFCNQVREGYAVQYINDDQLARATVVVKTIVGKAQQEDPSINTDEIWQAARQEAAHHPHPIARANGAMFQAAPYICQAHLTELFNQSPTPV
jgi:hypothetical protein